MNMKPFDHVSTSIAVTMRTKNELKILKGTKSYEEFLREMVRNYRKQVPAQASGITIETVTFQRAKTVLKTDEYSIVVSYNQFVDSPVFRFDIAIDSIRKKGVKICYDEYAAHCDAFEDYFSLLEMIIQKEIDPMFIFRKYGREDYKDYRSWSEKFKMLGLSKTSYEEDVWEKLTLLSQGKEPYD